MDGAGLGSLQIAGFGDVGVGPARELVNLMSSSSTHL